MKKIVIPFDGNHFSTGAFEFARRLNDINPILLAGIFLPDIVYPGNYGFTGTGVVEIPALLPFFDKETDEMKEKNILRFKELCVKHGIEHRVHIASSEFVLPQLKKETRYADMVIVASELFYDYNTEDRKPGEYLASFLHHTECPVLVIPEHYEFPENNIIAFDGSISSVFAIKQFAYVLPELCGNNTEIIFGDPGQKSMPDADYIEELAGRHFNAPTFYKFDADPETYFETMLADKKAPILVTGAYDRNIISRMFTKSFAEDTIRDFKVPVFIAHH